MQLLYIAFQQARGRPIRTVLSIMTLTLAVTALIAVAAASTAVTAVVRQAAIQQGGQPATILASGLRGSVGLSESAQVSDQLEGAQPAGTVVARVARLESIVVDLTDSSTPVEVQFVDPEVIEIYHYVLRQGTWLSDNHDELAAHAVVNDAAVSQLGIEELSTFKLRVPGQSSTVTAQATGVIQDSSPDPKVYITISNAEPLLIQNSGTLAIQLLVSGPTVTPTEVSTRLMGFGINFSTTTFETQRIDTVERLTAQVEATSSAFGLVGVFSLLAGVIGLANIGLAGVREQAAELSIRRAMGARWWHLPVITILETQLIAVLASVCAIASARAVYPVLASQLGGGFGLAPAPFPWQTAVLGLIAGVGAAALASLAPALKSLSVPISAVMRAE